MLKYYFFLGVFWVFFSVNGQSILRYNEDSFTFKQLNDTLNTANKKDGTYQLFLQLYLNKAKKELDTKHLFEAYYRFSGYEPSAKIAHIYTDSLFDIAKKLPEFYYIRALQTKATNYYYEKDYINSLKYELQALHKINKEKEPYIYYKSIYGIGLMYFHIQEYDKAYHYFNQARGYYQTGKDYNHVQGYFNSLYREAFALYYLNRYKESVNLIQTGLNKKNLLRADDVAHKISYFNYVQALNLYREKHYTESVALLKEQIAAIASKNDFANLATLYYYMGLNYQQLNNKAEAVVYFKKTDNIFTTHNYSNPEIKEAYPHLINYYREQKNVNQELFYTNRMIEAMQYLQREYQSLSGTLHYKFDIQKLQADKERLENDLNKQGAFAFAGGIIALLLFVIAIRNSRKKRMYLKNYNNLLKERSVQQEQDTVENNELYNMVTINQTKELAAYQWVLYSETVLTAKESRDNNPISKKIWDELTDCITTFEKEKQFLRCMNLNDLVNEWNINRTYISKFINQTKGKQFTDYLNDLRVDYFLKASATDKKWNKLKIEAIAQNLGFTSARSFSSAFLKKTKVSPSFYLKKEEEKEDLKEKEPLITMEASQLS